VKVRIEFTVEIDPEKWVEVFMAEEDRELGLTGLSYIRRDVKQWVETDVIEGLGDKGVLVVKEGD